MAKKFVPKTERNLGKAWSEADVQQLRQLAKQNTPTPVMGLKLGRTPASIRSKARALRLSLKPVNRSPYGTVAR